MMRNIKSIPVIVQATNKSTLMDSKTLAPLKGRKSVLGYLIDRLCKLWQGPLVLATSTEKFDDSLCDEASRLGIKTFRGSRDNVIQRLYDVTQSLSCNDFVRIFGSYPLTDLLSMKELVEKHLLYGVEYSYNGHRDGVLWGMECEVLSVKCLERLLKLNLSREQLETATLYVRQNPRIFSHFKLNSPVSRQNYKVALETEKDLVLLQDIVNHVPDPGMFSVGNYLDDHPILARSNHEKPAKEVGLEKLFFYPEKIHAIKNVNGNIDLSYPISVELSLTNRCNLKCVYCSDGSLRLRQGSREMLDKETLFNLFDDLKRGETQGVVIEGGGEPTIHPDFEEIVRYLSSIGLAAGLITNGTKPLTPEVLSSLEWIRVSLDASTPDEYYSLKKVNCFEDVLSNVFYYVRHCPTVGIGYVVTDSNTSEVETLVLRLREYGVSYIQFRPVVDCPELAPQSDDLSYLNCYQTKDFAIIADGMHENAQPGNRGLPCRAHSLTTVISAEGSVYLCGRLNIHEWVQPIGNICHKTFHEIWTGRERQTQAVQVLDPVFCRNNCPQCRISKFNQLVARINSMKTAHFI